MKKKKLFIGLMGVTDNGTLVTPNGTKLFRLPLKLARFIQKIQHKIAEKTWNFS